MLKYHLLNQKEKDELRRHLEAEAKEQETKQTPIDDTIKEDKVIEEQPQKNDPIDIPKKPKRKRRSKEEMAKYKKSREELVLRRAEYRRANEEFKKERKLRRESQDPELVKKKKEKMKQSPYRQFVKEFAQKNKGKLGKNYSKELSKAWKLHKSS